MTTSWKLLCRLLLAVHYKVVSDKIIQESFLHWALGIDVCHIVLRANAAIWYIRVQILSFAVTTSAGPSGRHGTIALACTSKTSCRWQERQGMQKHATTNHNGHQPNAQLQEEGYWRREHSFKRTHAKAIHMYMCACLCVIIDESIPYASILIALSAIVYLRSLVSCYSGHRLSSIVVRFGPIDVEGEERSFTCLPQ